MTSHLWRIVKSIAVAVLGIWAFAKGILDWIGRGTLFEDSDHTLSIIEKALNWVFSTPWWVPAILAAVATIALFLQGREGPILSAPNTSPRSRLRLEPIHLIILGLVIASGGAAWQFYRGLQKAPAIVSERTQPTAHAAPAPSDKSALRN